MKIYVITLTHTHTSQEAEVGGSTVPEPFDVRMEQAEEAGGLLAVDSTTHHRRSPQKIKKQPPKSPVHNTNVNCKLFHSPL